MHVLDAMLVITHFSIAVAIDHLCVVLVYCKLYCLPFLVLDMTKFSSLFSHTYEARVHFRAYSMEMSAVKPFFATTESAEGWPTKLFCVMRVHSVDPTSWLEGTHRSPL